jgi:hypothetical protein
MRASSTQTQCQSGGHCGRDDLTLIHYDFLNVEVKAPK